MQIVFTKSTKEGDGWKLLATSDGKTVLVGRALLDIWNKNGPGEYDIELAQDSKGRLKATEGKYIGASTTTAPSPDVPPTEVLRCLSALLKDGEITPERARAVARALREGLEEFYFEPEDGLDPFA